MLALPPVYLTKRVQIDGDTTPEGGSLGFDIGFCNRIEIGGKAVIGPYARLRPGTRLSDEVHIGNFVEVKNAQFGVGNVLSVEEHNDDMKVTVRFNSVGVKKLLAKYAKLEPA